MVRFKLDGYMYDTVAQTKLPLPDTDDNGYAEVEAESSFAQMAPYERWQTILGAAGILTTLATFVLGYTLGSDRK